MPDTTFETYCDRTLARPLWLVASIGALILVLLLFRDSSLEGNITLLLAFDGVAIALYAAAVAGLRLNVVPLPWMHPLCGALALVMVAKSLATLTVSGNSAFAPQTLLIVAILGGFMLSYRWFLISVACISALWIGVTAFTLQPRALAMGVMALLAATALSSVVMRVRLREVRERYDLEREVKVLRGLVPICAHCKDIKDEAGEWRAMESYITSHSEAKFTHGFCPTCAAEYKAKAGIA